MSNPDQRPHLFEADPSAACALRAARVVIANGIDYDPWMDKLLKADPAPGREEVWRTPWAGSVATTSLGFSNTAASAAVYAASFLPGRMPALRLRARAAPRPFANRPRTGAEPRAP